MKEEKNVRKLLFMSAFIQFFYTSFDYLDIRVTRKRHAHTHIYIFFLNLCVFYVDKQNVFFNANFSVC